MPASLVKFEVFAYCAPYLPLPYSMFLLLKNKMFPLVSTMKASLPFVATSGYPDEDIYVTPSASLTLLTSETEVLFS